MEKLPLNEGKDSLPDGAAGLETGEGGPHGGLVKTGERRAAYSDIDSNRHVNNARYVQWIQDIADPALLEQAERIRLDINYLSEVKIGETVEFYTAMLNQQPRKRTGYVVLRGDCTQGFDTFLTAPRGGVSNPFGTNEPDQTWAQTIEGRRPGEDTAVFRAELRLHA
jgi:hypothetical protein